MLTNNLQLVYILNGKYVIEPNLTHRFVTGFYKASSGSRMAPVIVSTMTRPLNDLPLNGPLTQPQKHVLSTWRPTKIRNLNTKGRKDFSFDLMEDALKAFAAGEFLVVMDDESRENEGDLIIAASHCTTEKMAWMIKHTRYVLPNSRTFDDLFLIECQRLRLYSSTRKPVRRTRHSSNGPRKPGQTSNSLHNHRRLQTRYTSPYLTHSLTTNSLHQEPPLAYPHMTGASPLVL